MFNLLLIALLFISTPLNTTEETQNLPRKHPLEEVVGAEKAVVVQEIETHLFALGFGPQLARAATINAYAESKLVPTAVGDHGKSIGVFQLHADGLGNNMSVKERMDIKTSATRIASAVHKDGSLLKLQDKCAPLEEMVKVFTVKIERPSNSKKKAIERAKLSSLFGRGLDKCIQKT